MFDLGSSFSLLVLLGALVGLAVGLTGLGGGSLMTPALVYGFQIPTLIAVGTDLAFAAITKSVGIAAHGRQGAIDWRTANWMMIGSIPACLITLAWMASQQNVPHPSGQLSQTISSAIKQAIGVALLLTALCLLFKDCMSRWTKGRSPLKHKAVWLVVASALIGALVALTSIGAGAVGCVVMSFVCRDLDAKQIAATDIAYATPLAAIAALGHGWQGNIHGELLLALLIGSTPAIWLGVRLGKRLPNHVVRPALALLLSVVAAKSLLS